MEDRLESARLVRPAADLGHTVIVKTRTGSTNDDVKALAESGAISGTVVIAEEQTRGRGRLNRSWQSPPGKNLLFSVALGPEYYGEDRGLVTLAAGVATAEAVIGMTGLEARIKWPNDVRIKGKKLAGILAETGGGSADYVVLGVGLNVNLSADELSPELTEIATSLRIESGKSWPRREVLHRVLDTLESAGRMLVAGRRKDLLARWQELCEAMGKKVRVTMPGAVIEGVMLGLREDGALRVRTEAGEEAVILAGDVAVAER